MSGISDPRSHVQSRTSADPDVIYVGYRRRGHAIVEKQSEQEQLTPERSLELADHSPSGFDGDMVAAGRPNSHSPSSSTTRMTKRSPSITTRNSKPRS